MGFLNVKLPNGDIYTLKYTSEDSAYIFENDIVVNGWTILKIVSYSTRGYTNNYYLEFVIKDKHEISRIHRRYTPWPNTYADNIDSVKEFIEHSLIFQCEDWADFDIAKTFNAIKEILNSNISKQEQLIKIKKLFNS